LRRSLQSRGEDMAENADLWLELLLDMSDGGFALGDLFLENSPPGFVVTSSGDAAFDPGLHDATGGLI
jgi:hypothetical protein